MARNNILTIVFLTLHKTFDNYYVRQFIAKKPRCDELHNLLVCNNFKELRESTLPFSLGSRLSFVIAGNKCWYYHNLNTAQLTVCVFNRYIYLIEKANYNNPCSITVSPRTLTYHHLPRVGLLYINICDS